MIRTYIIGTGYLSSKLSKKINNSEVVSSEKLSSKIAKINKEKKKINLILNIFFSSRKLNNLTSYQLFTKKSLLNISEIFDHIEPKLVNKILYTSSSSVYGSMGGKVNFHDKNNRFIYSSFKLSAESLVKNFCYKNKINFDICRIFNIYGLRENFSIISKLLECKKKKSKVNIYNDGVSVRDFIHIDDIVQIYKKLLKLNESNIFDIGTGKGIRIKDIVSNLNLPHNKVKFVKIKNFEIDNSIADNSNLIKKINYKKFRILEKFLKIKKLNFQSYKIKSNYLEKVLFGSIVYGAGYSGKVLCKQLSRYDKSMVSFFVDDDPNKIGKSINEIKILSYKELKDLSNKVQIRNIIIAIPSLKKKEKLKIIKKLLPISPSISSLPSKKYFQNNEIKVNDINKISLEELFDQKTLNFEQVKLQKFKNKKILITGGAGSIGIEICNQLNKSSAKKIIILDHSEFNIYRLSQKINSNKIKLVLGDIKDQKFISNIISKEKIDYIFHAAAYKHVKFLEQNILSAIKNNIIGTISILKAIRFYNVNFVFISTDKAVNPKTILGTTKRAAEIIIRYIFTTKGYEKCNFSIVRFGNVIGSDGSALPYFLKQIQKDLPILLTHRKMERYFMTINEACNLVLQSCSLNFKNKILFLDMGKPVKIIDLIKRLFATYRKPDQKLKIKITGNKFNEKITESLSFKEKIKKTEINKIFSIEDVLPKKNYEKLINQLEKDIDYKSQDLLLKNVSEFIK